MLRIVFLKTLITGIRSLEENDSRKAAREKSVQRVCKECITKEYLRILKGMGKVVLLISHRQQAGQTLKV